MNTPYKAGNHFLQIPGPTHVPDRILRAMDRPTIDHRGPAFGVLGKECLEGMRPLFKMQAGHVIIYSAGGTGSWEAAMVNTLSLGDRVLMFETGQFATLWRKVAESFGLDVVFVPGDWRHGIDPTLVEAKLREDGTHRIKAVMAVHSETSTGVVSRIAEVRQAMDQAKHPALLMVDAVSSLGSIDYRHDEWRVDVTVAGSQKGLMLPPGLGFNAVSEKAMAASKTARLPKSFWSWADMITPNQTDYFPYTRDSICFLACANRSRCWCMRRGWTMCSPHDRFAEATRRAVAAWGLELNALDPREYSSALTAVRLPEGFDEAAFRRLVLANFDLSLGAGLGKSPAGSSASATWATSTISCSAALSAGSKWAWREFGVPAKKGGVAAATAHLARG